MTMSSRSSFNRQSPPSTYTSALVSQELSFLHSLTTQCLPIPPLNQFHYNKKTGFIPLTLSDGCLPVNRDRNPSSTVFIITKKVGVKPTSLLSQICFPYPPLTWRSLSSASLHPYPPQQTLPSCLRPLSNHT